MKKCMKGLCLILACITLIGTLAYHPTEVHAAFNKKTAKKNVTVTYKRLSKGVLVTYKNKNKTALNLTSKLKFQDSDKNVISEESQKNLCIAGKSTATFFFRAPMDEYGNYINYSSYAGSFSVGKSKYKSYSNKIIVNTEIQPTETTFAAVNMSSKTLTNIRITAVFYDAEGKILDATNKYLNCYKKNSIDQFTINYAGEHYLPAKVKVYVDWAY